MSGWNAEFEKGDQAIESRKAGGTWRPQRVPVYRIYFDMRLGQIRNKATLSEIIPRKFKWKTKLIRNQLEVPVVSPRNKNNQPPL